ncbi:hypothetical protein C7H85_17720 [Zobellella endophytica]|uniref:Uncharacterized protein n=1 Tax=Zobellella endophytica TaxID=2116700 RepID=A0A2P7QWW4_9GAMM|nr:hypothetical protein [Zobellella endophytica]PSJ42444.1 hypothetical protein C7H85_17720 [Zobellella endophytica]
MDNGLFISFLTQCWRWSVFLMFPLLVALYSQLLGLPLADFDNGVNQHKWLITLLYLLYVLLWLRFNRRVTALLEQRRK